QSEMIFQISPLEDAEWRSLSQGKILVGVYQPLVARELMAEMAKQGITLFSMDSIPRISRAQSMDVLSSQSTVSGYKAVLLAATHLPRFFPMRSEEHTSELQSRENLVCRLLLEKKKQNRHRGRPRS